MLIAVSQIPSDKLAAYLRGRRDQRRQTESIIEALRLAQVIDISTGNMILAIIENTDQRPQVQS